MRKVSSPGASDLDIGVYALMTGFPFASVSASGLEDFTTTQEARGSKDASSSFNLKTNLAMRPCQCRKMLLGTCSLCGIVVIRFDPPEFKVDKVCRVKRTSLLELRRLDGRCHSVEVRISTQASYPSTDQVESYI